MVPLSFVRQFVSDLVKLRLPVTAAAVVATVVALVEPFGLDVNAAVLTGIVVAVGTVAQLVQRYLNPT